MSPRKIITADRNRPKLRRTLSTEGYGENRRTHHFRVKLVENCSYRYRSIVNKRMFAQKAEYDLSSQIWFDESITAGEESASMKRYPVLEISAIVTRKLHYWWLMIFLPLGLTTSVVCTPMVIPPEETGVRIEVLVGILLTTFVYKNAISDRLPAIQYLTIADDYIMFCVVLQVVIALLFAVFGALTQHGDRPTLDFSNFPITTLWVFLGSWVVGHVILFYWLLEKRIEKKGTAGKSNISISIV